MLGSVEMRHVQLILMTGVILAAAVFASCAKAPAKLERAHKLGQRGCSFYQESLHALIEVALEDPNQGESAHALGHVVEEWRDQFGEATSGMVEPEEDSDSSTRFKVRFTARGHAKFLPGYFDEISPAVDFRVKKIERFTKDGVGAPLKALRENELREPIEVHYPPEAITREITAVIHSRGQRGGVHHVEIEMLCTLYHENVVIEGRRKPLAADYSVALAGLLERAKDLSRSEVADLFTNRPKRDPKLFLMEPYDPRKEPLVMIHGLLDSPLAWSTLTNRLRSDPEIRRRYQIWHYLYNTSAPALYSGRILRTQYREMRREFDPGLDDRATQRATLLTHSMGGLVARGLITNPGNAFWDAGFTRPLSSLKLSPEDRVSLIDAFMWKSEPSVKTVIFIAVPHRGSVYADNAVGRLGQALVKPPNNFRAFYERISKANPGAFTEGYADLGEGRLDSVGALSPEQPTLKILADLPLGYSPTLYSIIGNRGKEGAIEESSDGIVDYWSSHLDEAASETIVPAGHAMLSEPEVIEETKRLLLLR
ncbi:MAG: hypothetical protein P1U58_19895 [Verrucomicrobiales bacterium]|nr:hypothetical protein [Verrucomicrobiales bacterium]